MQYQNLQGINKPLSRIIYGCTTEAMMKGENVNGLLDGIYVLGINTFDTAENYGLSEVSLGNWMKERNNRDDIVVITKGCHPYNGVDRMTPDYLRQDIEKSFQRLQTDYIDIYLLHRDVLEIPAGPIVEILNEYHKAGKIGAFGGSNWQPDRIQKANDYALKHGLIPFTVSSPNYSLCRQVNDPWGGSAGCVTISGEENKEARQWYIDNNIAVFAYSSLGRGVFTGKVRSDEIEKAREMMGPGAANAYCHPENFERLARAEELASEKNATVSQIALAWLLKQKVNAFPIVSASTAERIASNVKALEIVLSDEEARWLYDGKR